MKKDPRWKSYRRMQSPGLGRRSLETLVLAVCCGSTRAKTPDCSGTVTLPFLRALPLVRLRISACLTRPGAVGAGAALQG